MTAFDAVLADLRARLASGERQLIGVVGMPGAGKSTNTAALAQALGAAVLVLPMDGFHLSNQVLRALGRDQRKGAPDTFDVAGLVELLRRVRHQQPTDAPIYAPEYRREVEEGVAQAIRVEGHTPLIVVEGNYLLMRSGGWQAVRPLLDYCYYLEVDETLRQQRLLARHMRFGRSEAVARAWIASSDEPNARQIAATKAYADHVWRLGE